MTYSAALTRRPGTLCQAVRGIEARVSWTGDGGLAFAYVLRGDLNRLRIPTPGPPQRADGLWRRTCFEAFVGVKGKEAYREFNFAPSGEWAVYNFSNYRERAVLAGGKSAPKIAMRSAGEGLELNAVVGHDWLPAMMPRARLKLALCAVIEEENGMLSYWALSHPAGKPDFHHADGFALEIRREIDSCGKIENK